MAEAVTGLPLSKALLWVGTDQDELQIIDENYKKKNISKEEHPKKKTLIPNKKVFLKNRLEEFKCDIVLSEKETDIAVLGNEGLLKAYVEFNGYNNGIKIWKNRGCRNRAGCH